MPRIKVSFDVGWHKRSSGRRYDSHSGHGGNCGIQIRALVDFDVVDRNSRICYHQNKIMLPAEDSLFIEDMPQDHDCDCDGTCFAGEAIPQNGGQTHGSSSNG